MKKTFKFFLMAAIVAAGFTACSSEEVNPGPDGGGGGGVVTGEATNATFGFKLLGSTDTKAVYPDNNENKNVTEFRVLIFNGTDNRLEVDTARTIAAGDSLLTIPLLSGTKKIYVFANGGTGNAGYLSIPKKGDITNLSDINAKYSLVTGTSPYTDLVNMHKLYPNSAGGTNFFYSSTVKESVIGLDPGISAGDSKDPANVNYVNVNIDRAVAKVAVTKKDDSADTKDGTGKILGNSVQYKFWTVNAAMYPFQNYVNGVLTTPEYIPTMAVDEETKKHYVRELGNGSSNAYIPVSTRGSSAPANGSYYYISENNPSTKTKGNTTIAAVEAVFLPKASHHIAYINEDAKGYGVNYNEALTTFTVWPGTTDLSTGSDMYLFTKTGVLGLPENTLFAGTNAKVLAQKVWYHLENPTTPPLAITDGKYTNVTEEQLAKYFVKYTAGKAYYRLNIGEQTGASSFDYMVRRNWYYDCNITGFLKLGENDPKKLVEPENEILEGPTNLSVHIVIRDWTGRQINTDI